MNRFVAPALIAVVLALPAASAEPRNLSGFHHIAAENGVEVELSIGPRFSVEVTGRNGRDVRTEVRNDTLRISRNMPWFGLGVRNFDGHVRVTMPALQGISVARGATLNASGVNANELDISAAMGGTIEIAGACRTLDASVAMGGVLSAENLHCDTANISAAMGGTADIFAARSYDASASMGGTIDVSGPAQRGDVSTSMGGTVSQD